MAFKNWKNLVSEEELDAQIARAKTAAIESDATEPRAASVSFDQSSGLVVIALKNGAFFSFPPSLVQGLGEAPPEDLSDVWLDASGSSVHWDRLDADFEIAGLVAGVFGTRSWMSEMGRKGGQATSLVKAEAARNNGKKGGRPKKSLQQNDLFHSFSSSNSEIAASLQ
jgi:general stress protein YciG